MLKTVTRWSAFGLLAVTGFLGSVPASHASVLESLGTPPLIHKAERALLKGYNAYVLDLLDTKAARFSKAADSAHAYSLMCQANYQLGNNAAAIENCSQALTRARPNWIDYQARGAAYYRLGLYTQAEQDLLAAVKLAPAHAGVQRNLKIIRRAQENTQLVQNEN